MRPELLDDLKQQGYVEVYKEQIKDYIKIDREDARVYLNRKLLKK